MKRKQLNLSFVRALKETKIALATATTIMKKISATTIRRAATITQTATTYLKKRKKKKKKMKMKKKYSAKSKFLIFIEILLLKTNSTFLTKKYSKIMIH